MSSLIVTLALPSGDAAPEYGYVRASGEQQAPQQGKAVAALLPAGSTEVVAVVPARLLSWHRIALPQRVLRTLLTPGVEPARARGILAGVLEEQLLDDPEQLHFAVFPADAGGNEAASSETEPAWVAACDRAWLHGSLQTLEAAGHLVTRVVAECTPSASGSALAYISGALQPAQMLLCTDQGVSLLPLGPASLALAQAQPALEVLSEPTTMALAQSSLGPEVRLQTRAQHLLAAAQSPWNLAQLELRASGRSRLHKRLAAGWNGLLNGAAWRPLRLGLLALLVVQVLAINAMAWRQRSQLAAQRASINSVLQQSFPQVGLVLDAPVQMQRAVDDLAQSRGQTGDSALARALAVIAPLAPDGLQLAGIDMQGRQLRLELAGSAATDTSQTAPLLVALQAAGLNARLQDSQLLVSTKEGRP